MEDSFHMGLKLPRFCLKCSHIITSHDEIIRKPGEKHKQMLKPTHFKKVYGKCLKRFPNGG